MIYIMPTLASTHIFYPVATETVGTRHAAWPKKLIHATGSSIITITEDFRKTNLVPASGDSGQALQRGNTVSFSNTIGP